MPTHKGGVVARSVLFAGLLIHLPLTGLSQVRTGAASPNPQTTELQDRGAIQKVIDQSTLFLQDGDKFFNEGNYKDARKAYDRAIDTILEAGVDVRLDANLSRHYQFLVDHIFQRQLSAAKSLKGSGQPEVAIRSTGDRSVTLQYASLQQQNPTSPAARGFGQQAYEPSPLDELAQLKLTDDELKDATKADVESAVAGLRLDFDFKPNALVQSYINYYLGRGRTTMESGLRRSGRFMDMARRIFREEGVPQDIVWLGQVESAWSPIARSWAAAVGLWQFIPGTGAQYGLRQDAWVDERSSFEKATRASARYLKTLSDRYAGNWELAMAAYNSGEGRVDSAIARTGYADFWEIYSRGMLPTETRNYVPNILATIIIAKNPQRYGFNVKPEPPLEYDLVRVNTSVDLRLVADALDTTYDRLLGLNPELKRGITPPAMEHAIRVPVGTGKPLQAALKLIPADKRATWRLHTALPDDTFETIAARTGVSESLLTSLNGASLKSGQKVIVPTSTPVRTVAATAPKGSMLPASVAGSGTVSGNVSSAGSVSPGSRIVTYRVKSNESLADIAARYGIGVNDIAAVNGISTSTRVRADQVLKIPVGN